MIISLELSIAQLGDLSTKRSEELFSEILRSSRRGHHIVIVPRELARWAAQNLALSGQDRAHLEKVREEFTQLGGLRDAPTSRTLKIDALQQKLASVTDHVWSIGVEEVLASRFLEKTVLLLENATNDGELLGELISHEARRRGIRDIAFQVTNGGGGTTYQEVERITDLNQIFVCICDHDKLTPFSPNSETFRKAKSTADRKNFVGTIITTPGREIENFLPMEIVCSLYPEYPVAQKQKLEGLILAQNDPNTGDCLWLYFDVKEGVSSCRYRQRCASEKARHWVEEKYQIDDLNEDEVRIDGFGQNVVERFLANGAGRSALHKFSRSEYWLRHFVSWFDNFLPFIQGRSNSRV